MSGSGSSPFELARDTGDNGHNTDDCCDSVRNTSDHLTLAKAAPTSYAEPEPLRPESPWLRGDQTSTATSFEPRGYTQFERPPLYLLYSRLLIPFPSWFPIPPRAVKPLTIDGALPWSTLSIGD